MYGFDSALREHATLVLGATIKPALGAKKRPR